MLSWCWGDEAEDMKWLPIDDLYEDAYHFDYQMKNTNFSLNESDQYELKDDEFEDVETVYQETIEKSKRPKLSILFLNNNLMTIRDSFNEKFEGDISEQMTYNNPHLIADKFSTREFMFEEDLEEELDKEETEDLKKLIGTFLFKYQKIKNFVYESHERSTDEYLSKEHLELMITEEFIKTLEYMKSYLLDNCHTIDEHFSLSDSIFDYLQNYFDECTRHLLASTNSYMTIYQLIKIGFERWKEYYIEEFCESEESFQQRIIPVLHLLGTLSFEHLNYSMVYPEKITEILRGFQKKEIVRKKRGLPNNLESFEQLVKEENEEKNETRKYDTEHEFWYWGYYSFFFLGTVVLVIVVFFIQERVEDRKAERSGLNKYLRERKIIDNRDDEIYRQKNLEIDYLMRKKIL
ncbi:hypothetical protein SNEBB_005089 [Seison nebaliae]|nr:hypothetical protein SNEBB_005089 [Seison nebaliae]